MVINTNTLILVIENYETIILKVIKLFSQKFGEGNPLKKWRSGSIERVGFLDIDRTIEYSLHGAGCTVEFKDGVVISFDFDEEDLHVYTPFKLKSYLDSSFNDLKYLTIDDINKLINELVVKGEVIVVKNEGIRLNSTRLNVIRTNITQ